MVRQGFRQLNLHGIEVRLEQENAAAMHVYEKIGFVPGPAARALVR